MTGSYEALAGAYDALTQDVEYEKRAGFVMRLLRRAERPVERVLDLACGTGSMTVLLAQAGYTMVGVDNAPEMLARAREKFGDEAPLLLCQSMPQLDLGQEKADAAVCCLDSINYLTRERDVKQTFRRVYRSLNEGGVFIFDVHGEAKMAALDGQVWLDETEERFCVWRTEYHPGTQRLDYWVDLFTQGRGGAWRRDFEEHHQRFYPAETLRAWLQEAGFSAVKTHGECRMGTPRADEARIYFSCIRKDREHG